MIKDAREIPGFFTLYEKDDKVWMEIRPEQFDQAFLFSAHLSHGIGEQFHTDLQIPHYYDPRNDAILLPGMTFTVEPMINAGKRSISIDLRAEGAQDLVLALVKHADIVLENFRPDVMPRLGIGYERLAAVNPKLIMLSISGFGQGGPESQRPAYAPIIHAEAGLLHRGARRAESGETQQIPLSVADTNASLHGLVSHWQSAMVAN